MNQDALDRMEPITSLNVGLQSQAYATMSIAISLKRIADHLTASDEREPIHKAAPGWPGPLWP